MIRWSKDPYPEFAAAVAGMLNLLSQKFDTVTKRFLKLDESDDLLGIEEVECLFPEWVYRVGFNPGLRAGFRFYLVMIDRLIEMLGAMSALCLRPVDEDLLADTSAQLQEAMNHNLHLLQMLVNFFKTGELADVQADLFMDIEALELKLSERATGGIEWLSVYPDYLAIVSFVRTVKDLRLNLLQLAHALPDQGKVVSH